jgi:hypothetical protein
LTEFLGPVIEPPKDDKVLKNMEMKNACLEAFESERSETMRDSDITVRSIGICMIVLVL